MKTIHSLCALLATALLFAGVATAQAFSSGSTGSDGALNYTTAGTYYFNPDALGLDPAGDNIFNFTTINIASGVNLVLQNNNLRGIPVVWLATGNVTIAGQLTLDGASAPNLSTLAVGATWITLRVPTMPGPGGYPGGVGALQGTAASPGLGPGGGPISGTPCSYSGSGSFATAANTPDTTPGPTYGNIQLVPLIGGSGGSGGCLPTAATQSDSAGGTGGAGGGAIRIVSSTSISVTGTITSQGGSANNGRDGGNAGGPGSGGAINLIAPTVTGTGTLNVNGGSSPCCSFPFGGGYILINASNSPSFTGTTSGGIITYRPLLAPPLPTFGTPPTISVVSVNGTSVPQPPQGQFETPDVTINSATPVTINISASGVPVGTVVQLQIISELAADQFISCNPLAGTTASSTATCSASFPTSVSAILASAVW